MAHQRAAAGNTAQANEHWIDLLEMVGASKSERDRFEAALDALAVGDLIRDMRERAALDPAQLKQRLKPFLNLSKTAIGKAERGMPVYHDERHLGDNVHSNFVLLTTVARICGFDLIAVPKRN